MAFRVSGAGNLPSHRTICGFRRRHPEDFRRLFVEVVRVARGMGPVPFGKLSADGTKVRANARRRAAGGAPPPRGPVGGDRSGDGAFGGGAARGVDGYVAMGHGGRRSAGRDAGRHPAPHRMVEKPATPAGRERYAQRKRLSEASNGRIGEILGFRRSGVRGLAKARREWDPVCPALNIKRLQPLPAG